jgi:hypothetical protein
VKSKYGRYTIKIYRIYSLTIFDNRPRKKVFRDLYKKIPNLTLEDLKNLLDEIMRVINHE